VKPPWEDFAAGSSGWTGLPLGVEAFVCRGARGGPASVITAGIHGDEYEGPAAAARLACTLTPGAVRGSVVLVPVANPMAWHAGLRVTPEDGRNLARTFPGDPRGTLTERLAAHLFAWISQADYLIDLHSGGVEYRFAPLAGFYGDPVAGNPSFQAARRFGLSCLWRLPETPGVLSCELHRRGRTAIGCEYLGGGQLAPEGVDAYVRGVLSCLAAWGMLPDEQALPPGGVAVRGDWVLAGVAGVLAAEIELGGAVAAGQRLGTISNENGQEWETLVTPRAGTVLALRSKAYIRKGDWAVLVASDA
jgi:predicted deacylase